jgi:hypothetical protein
MENHISENLWRNLIKCQLWHFVKNDSHSGTQIIHDRILFLK